LVDVGRRVLGSDVDPGAVGRVGVVVPVSIVAVAVVTVSVVTPVTVRVTIPKAVPTAADIETTSAVVVVVRIPTAGVMISATTVMHATAAVMHTTTTVVHATAATVVTTTAVMLCKY